MPPVTRAMPARSGQLSMPSNPACDQKFAHRAVLPQAVLEQQPAAGAQVRRRAGDDRAQRIEPVGPGCQRAPRLEAQVALSEVRVAVGHVRGVRDHEVEALARQRLEPAPLAQFDRQRQAHRVAPGDLERLGRGLGGDHPGARPVALDRERHRAAAGSQVDRARRLAVSQAGERQLDQQLGFRARNQDRRAHRQRQAVELASPEQVGHRLAGAAARRPVGEQRARLRRQVALGMRNHARLREAARFGEQQPGLARVEPAAGQRLRNRHAASSASSASCSAWCSARKAPIRSSSSPSMMRSILCSVRLMRWSVTRPCGKL